MEATRSIDRFPCMTKPNPDRNNIYRYFRVPRCSRVWRRVARAVVALSIAFRSACCPFSRLTEHSVKQQQQQAAWSGARCIDAECLISPAPAWVGEKLLYRLLFKQFSFNLFMKERPTKMQSSCVC